MVGEFGEVLVMDWGVAKMLDVTEVSNPISEENVAAESATDGIVDVSDSQLAPQSSSLTLDGAVMGSPKYMPLEQAEGRVNDIDERAGVYALGGILYAILTLLPPVVGRTIKEVLGHVRAGNVIPPVQVNSSPGPDSSRADGQPNFVHCPQGRVPSVLSSVAMKALASERNHRYADVRALAADVESFQRGYATSVEGAGVIRQFILLAGRHPA